MNPSFVFEELCDRAYRDVRSDIADHTRKIAGFFNNQMSRRAAPGYEMQFFRETSGALAIWGLGMIPFVGGLLSKAADLAMSAAQSYVLKQEIKEKQDMGLNATMEKGQLLIQELAQKYVDAIRKVDDVVGRTAPLTQPRPQFKNCSEIAAYLRCIYYYKYRLARLRFYHEQVFAYCKAIDKRLEEMESQFRNFELKLKEEGAKSFEDWNWHYINCNECYWPRDDFDRRVQALRAGFAMPNRPAPPVPYAPNRPVTPLQNRPPVPPRPNLSPLKSK